MSDIRAFVTPRSDALSRMAKDLVNPDDPRAGMIERAAEDMERFERFVQSCFLDFDCECNDYRDESPLGPKCRACAARLLYFDGIKTAPPTAYVAKDPTP